MPTVPAPRPMTSSLDAIEVILTLLDREPGTTLAALVDGLPDGARAVLSVRGGDPGPAGATHLAAFLTRALPRAGRPRVVLVSVRAGSGDAPEEADLATWRALARCSRTGPELLDWFVVTDEAILSLAELAGPAPRWLA